MLGASTCQELRIVVVHPGIEWHVYQHLADFAIYKCIQMSPFMDDLGIQHLYDLIQASTMLLMDFYPQKPDYYCHNA